MTSAILEIEEPASITGTAARLLEAGPATDAQQAAWEKFQSLPLPARTDEAWRFSNLKQLDLSRFGTASAVDNATRDELIGRSRGLDRSAGRMVFANDALVARELISESLRQKGVIWLPLDQALAEHGDLVRSRWQRRRS